jgi:uncharacterized protein YvpB
MLKFLKYTFLGFFFGVVPVCLIAVIAFFGFKIYNDSKSKYNLKGIALESKSLTLPKLDTKTKANSNPSSVDASNSSTGNIPNMSQANATVEKKVDLPKSVLLKVQLQYQPYSLDCEATSLSMALNYRGIKKTPQELQEEIGYAAPYKKEYKDGKFIWGDPNIGYVGNEKGFLFTASRGIAGGNGWGVNNGPIAKIAQKYRDGSLEKDNATLEDLKQALAQDKPVIFWHQRDDARKEVSTYNTPEGKEIKIFQNHVNLLIGYNIDSKGNTRYIFNDPIFGQISYSEKDLIRVWGKYNNEIVIVN